MRSFLTGLLAALLASTLPQAQSPAAGTATFITGRVSDARDDAPLRRARVTLTISGTVVNEVFTDDAGRFELRNASEGSAVMRVAKAGYAAAQVDVSTRRAGAELRFRLARSAAIMGRVVDSAGAPVAGVQITGRLVVGDAEPTAAATPQLVTQTDRFGEYRLGGLPAGRYELAAVPTGALESARAPAQALNPGDGFAASISRCRESVRHVAHNPVSRRQLVVEVGSRAA